MAALCGISFGACVVRLTRVDAQGNVIAGNNSYVSDKLVSIAVNPNIETGNTFSARNGCGCGLARFKAPDVFNWWEFAFVRAALEPIMDSFLLGAAEITDGADVVGIAYPSTLACNEDEPAVALEFWTQHIVGSGQDATFPWVHFVFPMTIWHVGTDTFAEALAQPTVDGFSRTNPQWGDGPYGDGPPDSEDISEGGWWKTDVDPPAAVCAAQAVTDIS